MSSTTIRSGGKGYCFYSIDGASWVAPYNNQIIVGRGNDGTGLREYRCYFALNLSALDKSRDLLDSAVLHLTNTTDYSAVAKLAVGIRTSVPDPAFSTGDFDENITPSGGLSTSQGSTTMSVSKTKLQKYLGRTIYICMIRYDTNNNYAELGALKSSNDPYIALEYTVATSTLDVTGNTIGSPLSLDITSNSPSFTHTITYTAGGASGTIATKTSNASVPWTPPMSLCSQNTSGTTVSCVFTLDTYSGSTKIGTSTKTVSLKIPSSVKPEIASDAVTLSPLSSNAAVQSMDEYVASYSYVHAVWNKSKVTTAYGASITAYKMTINGEETSCTGSTPTGDSSVIQTSGTFSVTLSVTDARGRTASISKSIKVYAYNPPYISGSTLICARANALHDEEDGGSVLKLRARATISSINSKNSGSVTVRYRAKGGNWTTLSGDFYSTGYYNINMDADKTYIVEITPADLIKTGGGTVSTVTLPPKTEHIVAQHFQAGTGVGIGRAPEDVGAEVVGKGRFFDDNGIARIVLNPDGYGLSAYDSTGTLAARIRDDGQASEAPVPISSGGTRASTARGARANLGIPMEFLRMASISSGSSKTFTVADSTQFLMMSTGAAGGNNSPKGMWIGNVTSNGATTLSEIFKSSTNLSVSTSSGSITVTNSTQYACYVYFIVFNDGSIT